MAAPVLNGENPPAPNFTTTRLTEAGAAGGAFSRQGLRRPELAALAAKGPAAQALALANRDDLDETLIAALADRPEPQIVHALAANNRARIGRPILRALIERGRGDPKLAQFLLRREDLHLCHLRLFLQADAEQRGHLIAITCRSRLGRHCGATLCQGFDPGKLAQLERAALNRDMETFRRLLAHALICDLPAAIRIAEDKSGEALALALVALGLPAENAARLLQYGFPDICKAKPNFRALIGIVGRVSRSAATNILHAVVHEARVSAA
jgi:uncharacterized protein (DUF2336 family)